MRPAGCPQEVNVREAVRAGTWQENLSAHVAACPDCRETVHASRWMQALAQSPENPPALPDAGRVWWRARVSERQAKAERAQEIFEWVEIIFASAVCAGLAVWIVRDWFAIQMLAVSILAGSRPHSWISSYSALGMAPTILTLGAVIVSILAIVLAYPMLARD